MTSRSFDPYKLQPRLELANDPDKEFTLYFCNAILYGFEMLIYDCNI